MQQVISFIGPKNSGKTTTVSELTHWLSMRGFSVAALKHVEKDELEYNTSRDSARHFEHGAQISIASDDEVASILVHLKDGDDPGSIIERFLFDVDFVLVEGYSKSRLPKAIFVTGDEDEDARFKDIENVLCAIFPLEVRPVHVPAFNINDIDGIGEFVLNSPELCYEPVKAALYVNGKRIYIKDFVQDFIKGAIMGMTSSLRGTQDARSIVMKIRN
ncbi:MAG: molybdopterin-guanine dinucleotide biosynthesis protein B [Actinobacteria bacterium]|nr:molybdopterin-guanine dinucleotide biosynthesis protein B [Actinomycetota bacterium]